MSDRSLLSAVSPRSIVVFRALQLGDMLCAVPAFRALRGACPSAHITLVGLPWSRTFVDRYCALIDEMVPFPGAVGFPEQDETDEALPAFYDAMRARRFGLAIQMHGSGGVANEILINLGARHNAGFVQRDEAGRIGCFIPWPDTLPEPARYTTLMEALGVRVASRDLDFPLTSNDDRDYEALAAQHSIDAERLVLVHPGAQLSSRRWPSERFAAVADALAGDGWQIAITGSAQETEITRRLLGAMTAPALHLAGATSLGGLAALVARAQLVICNDTGISHVAAAMRVRSVVVASGSDTRRWAPLDRERHRVFADYPLCRPCAFRDCPYGHPCALNVEAATIIEAAREQLAASPSAHRAASYAAPSASPNRASRRGSTSC